MTTVDGVDADAIDVLVVGAGFSGIQALYDLRQRGHSVLLVEQGDGVGGTWFWNRYPGARVDVESLEYSLAIDEIQQEWEWTERYSSQPEVERYLNFVADRLDLCRDIRLRTRLATAVWDEEHARWTVGLENDGSTVAVPVRHLVLATGFLSAPVLPDVAGIGDFGGTLIHTARWPIEPPDLAGRAVGVIGTSASGVQVVQTIAPVVGSLAVFQRTAAWVFPLRNQPMDPAYQRWVKERYGEIRDLQRNVRGGGTVLMGKRIELPGESTAMSVADSDRFAEWERRWAFGGAHISRSYTDLVLDPAANDALREFMAQKIRSVVDDPVVADKLVPKHRPFTRRPPGHQGYLEAFNRPNVTLVDVEKDPIDRITEQGVRLTSGAEYPLDLLVCATGFDAGGGAAMRIEITGRGGRTSPTTGSTGRTPFSASCRAGFPTCFSSTVRRAPPHIIRHRCSPASSPHSSATSSSVKRELAHGRSR